MLVVDVLLAIWKQSLSQGLGEKSIFGGSSNVPGATDKSPGRPGPQLSLGGNHCVLPPLKYSENSFNLKPTNSSPPKALHTLHP